MRDADAPVSSSEQWHPATDVYQANGSLVIVVELAGIRREGLQLSAKGNRLTITGERPDDGRNRRCRFLAMEISYGPFERVLEIPDGFEVVHARAIYSNGLLRVEVPEVASP